MRNSKTVGAAIVLLLLLIAAITMFRGSLLAIGYQTPPTPSPIQGGTVTSIQNVSFFSNYPGLQGSAFLVNFVVNGNGQALQGTQSQIAKGINSSYATYTNNPVSISYSLNNEQVVAPYYYSGAHLYEWGYTPVMVKWTAPACPMGLFCANTYPSGSNYNTTIIAGAYIGSIPYSFLAQEVGSYVQACQNSGALNPITVITAQVSGSIMHGITNGEQISLMCIAPVQTSIGSVFQSNGTYSVNANVSIVFSNGTSTETINLNSSHPSAQYDNLMYAQIYGYLPSGRNIYSGDFPSVIIFSNSTPSQTNYKIVNPISPSSVLSASATTYTGSFPYSWLQTPLNLGGLTLTNVFSYGYLVDNINQQNQNLNNYLYAPQNTSAYSNMQVNFKSGVPYGVINITSNPELYPEVQLVAKLSTLGVYVPVVAPKIVSVSPSQVSFQSGSAQTVTFTVYNNATVSGSAYITGACGNVTFSTPNFNIPAQGTAQESVVIPAPYNPNLANEYLTCVATVYSSSFSIYHSSTNFQAIVKPNCPAGYIYQNNQNCQPVSPTLNNTNKTAVCAAGYKYENGACVPVNVCPPGYYLNSTMTPPTCEPTPVQPQNNYLLYIIIVILVIIVVLLFSKGRKGRLKTFSTPKGKSHTFDYVVIALVAGLFIYMAYIGFLAD
ncbi:MAG: hypothetical protein ACP5MB_10855, partial [bacterium]